MASLMRAAPLAALLSLSALASVAADVCEGHRCDTGACPCGCECGNKTDPGVCYVPTSSVIAGQGSFRFQYEPSLLQMPSSSVVVNSHGLAVDDKDRIYLTYQPAAGKDKNCLVRWQPNGTGPEVLGGGGSALCVGIPHGLRLSKEEDGTLTLYHANNNQALHKTALDGSIIWSTYGPPNNASKWKKLPYHPTWFETPPESRFAYMADGYGSGFIHVYNKSTGDYTGVTFGGPGKGNGTFHTPHAIIYDPRRRQLVVSDRENHRHQYFDYSPGEATASMRYHSQFQVPELKRPCTIRFEQDVRGGVGDHAVIANLEGSVGIVDANNQLVSLIEVNKLLGDKGHKHPHDAMFLPNGDLVVCTWNPGRISYWRRLPAERTDALMI